MGLRTPSGPVHQALLQVVEGVLSGLPTSLDADEELLASKNARHLDEQQRLAVQFRLHKKQLLAGCAKRLNARTPVA